MARPRAAAFTGPPRGVARAAQAFENRGATLLFLNGGVVAVWRGAVRRFHDLVVIGDLFPRPQSEGAVAVPEVPVDLAALVRDHWGRYLAFTAGAGFSGFRDPMGEVQLFQVSVAEGQLYFSHPDLVIGVCGFVPEIGSDQQLTGVREIEPGEAAGPRGSRMLWQASSFCRPGRYCDSDAARAMRSCLDAVLACEMPLLERGGMLLSGGLDSAIVLGSLPTPPRAALHHHSEGSDEGELIPGRQGPTDERRFAAAAAGRAGAPLTIADRVPRGTLARWPEAPLSVQPNRFVFSVDLFDAERAFVANHDIDAIFTGQAGDAVLFNGASPDLAADCLADRGLGHAFFRTLLDVAQLAHVTNWAVLRAALPGLLGRRPAKTRQLRFLSNCLNFIEADRPLDAVPLINPLHAQPFVELCLGIPAWQLAEAGIPRGLARRAFADRLPPAIHARHTKSGGDAYFCRLATVEAGFIEDFLGGGRALARGWMQPNDLAALRSPAGVAAGAAGGLLKATAVEGWLRQWEGEGVGG